MFCKKATTQKIKATAQKQKTTMLGLAHVADQV